MMGCTGAVLIAECREILKSLNNANPLRSEKAKMLALKNLVTKTKWESLFKTSNQQTNKPQSTARKKKPLKTLTSPLSRGTCS